MFDGKIPDSASETALVIFDSVAHDLGVQQRLGSAQSIDEDWDIISDAVRAQLADPPGLAGMGFDWLKGMGARVKEALGRGTSAPGYVLSRAVAEFRSPLNELICFFMGDVFEYLNARGTADTPGEIQRRFLKPLERAHERRNQTQEPIVVVSHSMGGQIVYDAVTHFLPENPTRRLGFTWVLWQDIFQ